MVGKIVPPHAKEFNKITNSGTGGRGQLSGNVP